MKVLVLGGDGMLGHNLVRVLVERQHDVVATTRRPPDALVTSALVGAKIVSGVDARNGDSLVAALAAAHPEAVVNAIGVVKQRAGAQDALESVRVNSLLPHELAALCAAVQARLIHISTDCVFSGRRGMYRESDTPDPLDLYGRSKLLGEVTDAHCLTLRTSIIGLELDRKTSLVEWFLQQSGLASGWTQAIYSGVTTAELSRLISDLVVEDDALTGLWHVSSAPIDKFTLLSRLRDKLAFPLELVPDDSMRIDRTLNSDAFRAATGYQAPTWDEMLEELAADIGARAQ